MLTVNKRSFKTFKEARENKLYCTSFILNGNNKLLDYDDQENGISYRYAQFNTRARIDCPYASKGCLNVCYACTGNHNFPSVKKSRERSYNDSLKDNFADMIIFTIEVELQSGRYKDKHMIVRIHESGDFYSFEYLLKWIKVFEHFENDSRITFCFYTKSFKFFLELDEESKAIVNRCLENNVIAMSLSIDDTTTFEQLARATKIKKLFPLVNVYYCTENIEAIEHDNKCDCENCAKCGTCTKTSGKVTVVKIHSASEKQLVKYRKASRKQEKKVA